MTHWQAISARQYAPESGVGDRPGSGFSGCAVYRAPLARATLRVCVQLAQFWCRRFCGVFWIFWALESLVSLNGLVRAA